MTLEEVEALPGEYLLPKDVAKVLDCDQYSISLQAQDAPEKLGFPVVITGRRVRIPKAAFLHFMRFGRPQMEPPAEWIDKCRQAVMGFFTQSDEGQL